MSAVSSASTRKPIETTSTWPSPIGVVIGAIFGRSPSARVWPSTPDSRPSSPSMRGTEKPQMSASRMPTL